MKKKLLISLYASAVGLALSGQVMGQAAPTPYTTYYRYDAARRVVGIIKPDPDGTGPIAYSAIRNTYNAQGLLYTVEKGELPIWVNDWAGYVVFQTTTITYDNVGRKLSETVASGGTTFSKTQTGYDNQGRVICTTVRMNAAAFASAPTDACTPRPTDSVPDRDRVTVYGYDATTHVLQIQKAVGTPEWQNYATYTYTANGQIQTEEDANGNQTKLAYDGLDRLTYQYFPSKTTTHTPSATDFEQYGYDAVYGSYSGGDRVNRTSLRKRDGNVINYQFDQLKRLVFKDIPGTTQGDVYYRYDLRGLQTAAVFGLASAAGPSTTGITTTYDGFGRVATTTNNSDGVARQLSYSYDADGDRLSVTHPDSVKVVYGYDGLDRVSLICATAMPCTASASPIIGYVYDNQGRVKTVSRGASVASTTLTYDPVSRLQSLTTDLDGAVATNDIAWSFTYNPSSQILTKGSTNALYDTVHPQALQTVYVPNGLNQYTTLTPTVNGVAGAAANPSWDANGNLQNDGSNNGYAYDVENRLTSVSGNKTGQLYYDPNGRLYKVSTTTPASETHFLYDGDAVVAEYNSTGQLQRRYVHGPGADVPLVWYEGATVSTTNRYYLFANHQGSIVAIANNAGAKTAINTYDPYGIGGTTLAGVPTNTGLFQYTGQIWLPQINLYYYKARMYSPQWGRFLQTDPIGYRDDLDLYTYVGNDPLDKTDPSGKTCTQANGSYDCKVDTYVNWRGKEIPRSEMSKRQIGRVANFEKAYTAAVNKLMANPTKETTVSIAETGKSATVSAGAVGNALIGRNMIVDNKVNAMGTSGSTTHLGPVGLSGEGKISGVTPGSSQSLLEIAVTHEGLHGSDVNIDSTLRDSLPFNKWNGSETQEGVHQGPYNRGANDLLGPE